MSWQFRNVQVLFGEGGKFLGFSLRIGVFYRGCIILDQFGTVDRSRLNKKLGAFDRKTIHKIKKVIKEMLVD